MDSLRKYHLLNDSCEDCQYTAHAFQLFKVPFEKINADKMTSIDSAAFSSKHTYVICQHTLLKYNDLIDKIKPVKSNLIVITDKADQLPESNFIFRLARCFSNFELTQILNTCHHNMNSDEETINNSVFERLLGNSAAITNVKKTILQVAKSDVTVLILGQSGTGKDIVASCIHYLSDRKEKPYVPMNCGAIPGELIESELFGHEKGAFTGAVSKRQGRFELAKHGSLFLDEIGDMPLHMQVKLLRVLQDRKFERIGGVTSIDADVRIIAATNKNLDELIKTNQFRSDLYYRINVFPIIMPNLNERAEDIPALINYHLNRIQKRTNKVIQLSNDAVNLLCHYSWPGNIRELENFLERMVILNCGKIITADDIERTYHYFKNHPAPNLAIPEDDKVFNIEEYLANIEKQAIEHALKKSGGIINHAAEYLSIGTQKLLSKIEEYNLALHSVDNPFQEAKMSAS